MLREEVLGTVDDIRQKGAIGALRDAALDTKDLALDAGGWLVEGVKGIVADEEEEEGQAYVVGPDVPKRGCTCMLHLPDGQVVEATAIDVDGVSEPPRVRVTAPGLEEPLLVPILDPASVEAAREAESNTGGMSVIDSFKQELNLTVQEFREKGAVGAMKDAALDAVDMVGSTAKTAVDGAKSLAEPVAQDFREKGAVGAVKDAALDAVDIIGSTAKTAVNGAQTLATPLIDLLDLSDPEPAKQPGGEGAPADAAGSSAAAAEGAEDSTTLLGGLRDEWRNTVKDFREKGAVGAVKDAAMDAVDLVGSTATTAIGAANTATTAAVGVASTAFMGARARAAPLIEQVSGGLPDLWADASASASSSQPTAEGAAPQHTESAAAAAPVASASKETAAGTPKVFAPPPRSPAGADADASPKASTSERSSPRSGNSSPQTSGASAPQAKEPVPESSMPAGSGGKKSLVSMRRGMFEKPKQEEAKNEAEELID